MPTTVRPTADFDLDGTGTATAWATADWLAITAVGGADGHLTRAKLAYSTVGLYCLFDCVDHRLTCASRRDGDDLWHDDVVELFLWPDERQPLYFEYELSPLGTELALLVPNHCGTFMGWSPWHYEGDRRVRRATAVRGGPPEPGAAVAGWSAEVFVPFALLKGLGNVPPTVGTRWRANLCRIDHDAGLPALYSWAAGIGQTFHDLDRFGTLVFE